MDPAMRSERASTAEAEDFVRFCYHRRRVGWPDLYDEMCRVAHRGQYKGMGLHDLADIGIGFSLFETSRLASIVGAVVAEEQATRARLATPVTVVRPTGEPVRSADDPEVVAPLVVAAASA
jgi:hypothetical protein